MANINNFTVGGVVSGMRVAQKEGQSHKMTIQTPVAKQDGTQGFRFTTVDFFGNADTFPVGASVLATGNYSQNTVAGQDGQNHDFRSLVANRVQFTGTKNQPVVIPILEAEIAGNVATDLRMIGQSGGVSYSVAINSYKKPTNPGEQAIETTSFVNVVDFTGQSVNLAKGMQVFLKGSFSQGSFTRQDGSKGYNLDFNVTQVIPTMAPFQPAVKQTTAPAPAAPAQPMQMPTMPTAPAAQAPAVAPAPTPVLPPNPSGFVQPPVAPVAPATPGFNIPTTPAVAPAAPAPMAPPQGFQIPTVPAAPTAPAVAPAAPGFNIPAAPSVAPAAPTAPAAPAQNGFTIPTINGMGMPLQNMAN